LAPNAPTKKSDLPNSSLQPASINWTKSSGILPAVPYFLRIAEIRVDVIKNVVVLRSVPLGVAQSEGLSDSNHCSCTPKLVLSGNMLPPGGPSGGRRWCRGRGRRRRRSWRRGGSCWWPRRRCRCAPGTAGRAAGPGSQLHACDAGNAIRTRSGSARC
jgi:hypothetical protein